MKYILRVNGWELCPYCHKFLVASLMHNVRNLLRNPARSITKLYDDWIHIIYSNTYSTYQEKIVPFFPDTPAMLLDDTLYVSPAHWKITNEFLKSYFNKKWFRK